MIVSLAGCWHLCLSKSGGSPEYPLTLQASGQPIISTRTSHHGHTWLLTSLATCSHLQVLQDLHASSCHSLPATLDSTAWTFIRGWGRKSIVYSESHHASFVVRCFEDCADQILIDPQEIRRSTVWFVVKGIEKQRPSLKPPSYCEHGTWLRAFFCQTTITCTICTRLHCFKVEHRPDISRNVIVIGVSLVSLIFPFF